MDNQRPEAIRGKSLHAMTTEQLEELLRHEQDANREPDVELIEKILAVLDDRTEAPKADIEAAWEDFTENYLSGVPLYPTPDDTPSKSVPARKKPLSRIGIAAAILAAVILGISVSASASGFNLWNVLIQWSSETLGISFGIEKQKENEYNPELYMIFAALARIDIKVPLAPSYLPDGYKQTELFVDEYTILGQYDNDNKSANSIFIQYKKKQSMKTSAACISMIFLTLRSILLQVLSIISPRTKGIILQYGSMRNGNAVSAVWIQNRSFSG